MKIKEFTFFWLTGKAECLLGNAPHDALNKAGYGGGALRALDFYGNGDIRSEYEWNPNKREWNKTTPVDKQEEPEGV